MQPWQYLAIFTLWPIQAFAGYGYGTWISGDLTANAFATRRIEYAWNLNDSPCPSEIRVRRHHTKRIYYTTNVARTVDHEINRAGVRGEVCVRNEGLVPTRGLRIDNRIESTNGSDWVELRGFSQEIVPEQELAPGEQRCFPYRIDAPLAGGREFHVRSIVHLANFVGRDDDDWGIEIFTPFEARHEPEVANDNREALLNLKMECPVGFACAVSAIPRKLSDNARIHYVVAITNLSVKSGNTLRLPSTLELVERDSQEERDARSVVRLDTGGRCGD